jgi:hypothetical protein
VRTTPSSKRTFRQMATLAIVIAWGLVASAQAGYVVTLQEVGTDIVATGSGAIDLTGLNFNQTTGTVAGLYPSTAFIGVGPNDFLNTDHYTGTTGPPSFGIGSFESGYNGSGDFVGIIGRDATLIVPEDYVSGSPLSSSSMYAGPFASAGLTPGTYTWTWGPGANQNFTLVTVPEPATLSLLMSGVLLLLVAAAIRSRHLA